VELMKAMARTQQAVTFLSRIDVAEDVKEGSLVFVPFPDSRHTTNQLALVSRSEAAGTAAAARLEQHIRAALHEIAEHEHEP
jgi:DNA-binding transcriptional LysR family regulator